MRLLVRVRPKPGVASPVLQGIYDLLTGAMSLKPVAIKRPDWRDRIAAPRWTDADDQALRQSYAAGGSQAALAVLPDRTRRAIEARARKLQILAPHGAVMKERWAKNQEQNTQGTSGTARKASGAGESTPATRIPDRVPLQPEPEVVETPLAPTVSSLFPMGDLPLGSTATKLQFASPPGGRIRSGEDDAREAAQPDPAGAILGLVSVETKAASHPIAVPTAKKSVPISWIERQMAQLADAKSYLQAHGFAVTPVDRHSTAAGWHLSGWKHVLSTDELIESARRHRVQEQTS